jgi:hypothetical protein
VRQEDGENDELCRVQGRFSITLGSVNYYLPYLCYLTLIDSFFPDLLPCQGASYCSVDCQKQDWKQWHKRQCATLKKLIAHGAPASAVLDAATAPDISNEASALAALRKSDYEHINNKVLFVFVFVTLLVYVNNHLPCIFPNIYPLFIPFYFP